MKEPPKTPGRGGPFNAHALESVDLDLWRAVADSVKPLAPRIPKAAACTEKQRRVNPATAKTPPRQAATAFTPTAGKSASSFQLDRGTARRLASGDISIDIRLDLHGLTQDEALNRLVAVIQNAIRSRERMVLVITGKGRAGEGVLRRALKGWLALPELAPHILAVRPAQPRHGGDGAFYVLLRRIRDQARTHE